MTATFYFTLTYFVSSGGTKCCQGPCKLHAAAPEAIVRGAQDDGHAVLVGHVLQNLAVRSTAPQRLVRFFKQHGIKTQREVIVLH